MQQKRSFNRLLITSSVTGEGKSMVAGNLAGALAAAKQRVLLVEGDLRRPSLARQLGLTDLPGLSQALRNGANGLSHVRYLEQSAFCILLAGDVQRNPLELMEFSKLSAFIDLWSEQFDWIVIDSPPVLPLADTSIWMRMADAIMLVVRPGVTAKRQLQRTIEAIEQSKLLGTLINSSTEAAHNSYYYRYAAPAGELRLSSSTVR
jgi:capsular exopolysaccharide synthesis family protein